MFGRRRLGGSLLLLPPALWNAQSTAPASGPQKPFRLRRTRHDLAHRGLSGPCALSSGSRENGLSSVLVCGHTVHTLLMFGVAAFATLDKVIVPESTHEVCPNMGQTTVPAYLTAKRQRQGAMRQRFANARQGIQATEGSGDPGRRVQNEPGLYARLDRPSAGAAGYGVNTPVEE